MKLPAHLNRFITIFGVLILVGVGLYFAFIAVERFGLVVQQTTATVVDKTHRPAGRSYSTVLINGRPHPVPETSGELYVLGIELIDDETAVPVDKRLYDAVESGDEVRVAFRRRRITGEFEIIDVRRE